MGADVHLFCKCEFWTEEPAFTFVHHADRYGPQQLKLEPRYRVTGLFAQTVVSNSYMLRPHSQNYPC